MLATLEITPDDRKIIFCLHTSAYPSAQSLQIRNISNKCHYNIFLSPSPCSFPLLYQFMSDKLPLVAECLFFIYWTQCGLLWERTNFFYGYTGCSFQSEMQKLIFSNLENKLSEYIIMSLWIISGTDNCVSFSVIKIK